MKEYSSFKEIDRDLKILKLQTKIDQEEIKLNIERTKSALSPLSLAGSMVGSILQKAFKKNDRINPKKVRLQIH